MSTPANPLCLSMLINWITAIKYRFLKAPSSTLTRSRRSRFSAWLSSSSSSIVCTYPMFTKCVSATISAVFIVWISWLRAVKGLLLVLVLFGGGGGGGGEATSSSVSISIDIEIPAWVLLLRDPKVSLQDLLTSTCGNLEKT